MDGSPRFRCVSSPSAASRLEAAREFALGFPASQPLTIVATTRGAADDFARSVARVRPAPIGLSRFSLTQLAARIAAPLLAGRGIAPASALALEAVAARAAFETRRHDGLSVLAAAATTPGFPRALARTFGDLRLAGVPRTGVQGSAGAAPAAGDLAQLVGEAEQELEDARVADRARLFEAALEGVAADRALAEPLILLDLEPTSPIEERFARAMAAAARTALATVPSHDQLSRATWLSAGAVEEVLPAGRGGDLDVLQVHLFSEVPPPARTSDGSFEFFSAPGEGRECVEIARRVLREARRGVAFDLMAVLVRAPAHYYGLLEHAFRRADVPA